MSNPNEESTLKRIENKIAKYPDFPKKGILFRDIMPILGEPELFRDLIQFLCNKVKDVSFNRILGIESRGFLIGPAMAAKLDLPFSPIRKKGKLPGELFSVEYELEYGQDTLEIQKNGLPENSRCLIVDDLLATGGTLKAAESLVVRSGSSVAAFVLVIELADLKGREKMFLRKLLSSYRIRNTILSELSQQQQQNLLGRKFSVLSSLNDSQVLVSTNNDIFTNLALEQLLFTNLKFGNESNKTDADVKEEKDEVKQFRKPVVLIWVDEPCVVIGRHQNPWVELNLGLVNKLGVKLARRHSGGGCVYHDEQNINISIIGDRKTFECRQDNLKFLAKVLDENYGIKCHPTKRNDLIHSETGHKVSGSAAKLGGNNCYHHFTLLVNSEKEILRSVIRQKQQDFIKTNSSFSVRSEVINLKDIKHDLDVDQVIGDLSNAYGKLYGRSTNESKTIATKFQGRETDYQSLNQFRDQLQSWEWIYGMTPNFVLEKNFSLIEAGEEKHITFTVDVSKGLFKSINLNGNLSRSEDMRVIAESFRYLIGSRFNYKDSIVSIAKTLQYNESDLINPSAATIGYEKLFATFLLKMIHEANFESLAL